jgi:hypothetical protein
MHNLFAQLAGSAVPEDVVAEMVLDIACGHDTADIPGAVAFEDLVVIADTAQWALRRVWIDRFDPWTAAPPNESPEAFRIRRIARCGF